ncbi:TIGR00730 family Rossman fold protein [Streptomyces angustmyceticus]|uniref:Cytokinin riboside 5'-monophosphate phosphoribohydrolase n=1 Tax=Streptomyces angustmyceticus TaxID=285578 RepID=A0A5J4LTE5_9ACTN|nr:TIGR00730 family Rossman fold protein [Streptomyces angustmyceticus]UAL65929.1 TIGR00730 family Rossman fold protein [Streptomyces angustmyceticus]GES33548.1 cytokinin riboside 5'-monophosphate phosphoribohydrolase [Streptomyces angustmyceticus]
MKVTVYAGSAPGNRPVFAQEARRFARELVEAGCEIVYGGGAVGLMGAVADAALQAGGRVTGVMPRSLVHAEIAHPGLTELHVVDSMHERKQLMADLGDGFVALPGGVGTVEEIVEVWAWLVLGHHSKPVTLLDIEGYWDRLSGMARRMAVSGFLTPEELGGFVSVTDARHFLETCASWTPPPPRWSAAPGDAAPAHLS